MPLQGALTGCLLTLDAQALKIDHFRGSSSAAFLKNTTFVDIKILKIKSAERVYPYGITDFCKNLIFIFIYFL